MENLLIQRIEHPSLATHCSAIMQDLTLNLLFKLSHVEFLRPCISYYSGILPFSVCNHDYFELLCCAVAVRCTRAGKTVAGYSFP